MKQLCFPAPPPAEPPKEALKNLKERFSKEAGLWGTHDPAIFQDPESHLYYIYCTGAVCRRSSDLIHWETLGKVIDSPPAESVEWVGGTDIWAPDIVKVGDEYRLYCSNSTWGVRQSCIFLAVAKHPEGPFISRGCVLKTTDEMNVNAIDANIITDNETGKMYMIYGSFWGGCHILPLDTVTGLSAIAGPGTCVARRPQWMSGGIEGPYMIYQPDFGYYYLFVSYGSLKTDYNIRVGRSKSISGPFLDPNGKCLTDLNDPDNAIGLLIHCGYRWNDGTAYMAPGHNSVLCNEKKEWFLVSHIRELNFKTQPEPSTLQIRRLYWTPDGWPASASQPYDGEQLQPIPAASLYGRYERIQLTPSLPQGIQTSVPMKLFSDGRMECCSIQGTWHMTGSYTLMIEYGEIQEFLIASVCWDHELGCPSIMLSGKTSRHISIWAKKLECSPEI